MKWARQRDASAFLARVRSRLLQNETENCLIYAVTERIARVGATADAAALYTGEVDGEVRALAVAAPPRPLLITRAAPPEVVGLVEQLRRDAVPVAAVLGPALTSDAFAASWPAPATLTYRQGVHEIAAVLTPPLPSGAFRLAQVGDEGVLGDWFVRYSAEIGAQPSADVATHVAAHVADGTLVVWDDEGPVSMAACVGFSASGARIGGVYTPAHLRRRGYATACVAELSRVRLRSGDRKCMLLTDLANPTSNAIYASIGYRQVAELHEYRFA